ncbi:MarR family transcriptional regulator [Roseinatronobacter sp. NSM]|uniref:MarR family transcriptional regulator n=1 Tax=Roseinatronobacter sp. NSM TaxID=3457785 RepID=UPI004035E312
MHERINRFEWLKAVLRDEALNMTAKATASALAVQFCCDETGQINPKSTTLADYLGVSLASVKRAVTDLIKAGWLYRYDGRGNRKHTRYTLISPVNITPFRAPKGEQRRRKADPISDDQLHETEAKSGSVASLQRFKPDPSKGSNASLQRFRNEPFYIEQSSEQSVFEQSPPTIHREGRDRDMRIQAGRPVVFSQVVHHGTAQEADWNKWLTTHELPSLAAIGLRISDNAGTGWDMPWRYPPSANDRQRTEQALSFAWWLVNQANAKAKRDIPSPANQIDKVRYAGE